MGVRQSTSEITRSVTMDNPTPAGVIDVSDEVVQRLKLGINKAKNTAATVAEGMNSVEIKQQQQQSIRTSPTPAAATTSSQPQPVRSVYVATPPSPPSPSSSIKTQTTVATVPYLSSMEERRQKEIELQQNDQMWRNRMALLEQTMNKTNAIMEKEYSNALDDVRKRFTSPAYGHKIPPCQDLKSQLIACYRTYPGETLKCADEVARFRHCIGMNRVQKLDAIETAKVSQSPPKGA